MRVASKRLSMQRHQQGLSLVELMISLVLGLIVVSAVFNTFVGSSRSSKFTEGLQRMQENGRYGITSLQQGMRLAGYSPTGDLEPFDIDNSGDSKLVVNVQQSYDCNGGSTANKGGIAVNTYEHNPADDTISCTGNSDTAAPMVIVEGVEAMRILYGTSEDSDDTPEQFVNYSSDIDPRQIIGLRVAILVNSGASIRTKVTEEKYVLFDYEIDKEDRIARSVFTSTVMLRNRNSDR